MKFNNKKDHIEFHGTEMVNTYKQGTCWHCGQPTQMMDINFMAYICSEECSEAKWGEYMDASIGKNTQ